MSTSNLIPRTCTEVATDDSALVSIVEPQPLSAFREVPAYVLLGEPGAGKTTEFEQECHALGSQAELISARRFAKTDTAAHPEWRDKVLFIDGLDETRAGGREATEALDEIAARLEQLGRPRFRISCRAADWLGPVDRYPLAEVSSDGRVTALQLDPLKRSDVRKHLADRRPGADPNTFILGAESRGLGPMLYNPLTLELLIETTNSGGWPSTRREAFAGSCHRLVQELNPAHPRSAQTHPPESTLAAAGRLCAIQLLTGADGFMLAPAATGTEFIPVAEVAADIAKALAQPDFDLRDVFATSLFAPGGELCSVPKHRQIAEYLAAAHIADLLETGRTSVSRVRTALTSRIDDRIVTDLRGLAAWLGALSGEARRELIASDPVGMGLYGDISEWPADDRRTLLEGLIAQTRSEDLWWASWFDHNKHLYRDETAQRFHSLCNPDMVSTLEEYLDTVHCSAVPSHILELLLRSLSKAEDSWLMDLNCLVPQIQQLMFDRRLTSLVRRSAIDAFNRLVQPGEVEQPLLELLESIDDLEDSDGELAGTLLLLLYRQAIPPRDVWQHAVDRPEAPFGGRYWKFWNETLLEGSDTAELREVIDVFESNRDFRGPGWTSLSDIAVRIFVRVLQESESSLPSADLYRWLCAITGDVRESGYQGESRQAIRLWLSDHPVDHLALLAHHIAESVHQDKLEHFAVEWLPLPARPPNFVEWCAHQARAQAANDWGVACAFLEAPLHDGRLGEPREALVARLRSTLATDPQLLGHLEEYLEPTPTRREFDERDRRHKQKINEIRAEHEQERQQRQSDWRSLLRESRYELGTNCLSAPNLHTLAMAYFGRLVLRADIDDPRDRVAELIGDNGELLGASMDALRNAPVRDDVPSAERTAELIAESKHDWLAYPVLAGLAIRESESSLDDTALSNYIKRNALAIHAAVTLMPSQEPAWPKRWLRTNPTLALDVLYRCSVAALKNGDTHLSKLDWLDEVDGLGDALHAFRLRLLGSISVRLPVAQLPVVDRLLQPVLEHPDTAPIKELVAQKLRAKSMTDAQRVRWITLDAIMRGGDALRSLDDFIGTNEKRARQLAELLSTEAHCSAGLADRLLGGEPCTTLHTLVGVIGRNFRPHQWKSNEAVWIGPAETMSDLVEKWINYLAGLPTAEAGAALDGLIADERLSAWHSRLEHVRNRQQRLRRDASYASMNVSEVLGLLRDGPPANVADLHALLSDRLRDLGGYIRGDNSDPWRQFWADDRESQPKTPKHEESCRDALLAMLNNRLPERVDAQPEGQYAADCRADIRVAFKGYNIPVEIKKNIHPDLWTAIDDQLTAKYTTDPATGGYGIYLVLWLGADTPGYPRHPTDRDRPSTPDELERRLNESMSHEERRTISVVVLDVTKP